MKENWKNITGALLMMLVLSAEVQAQTTHTVIVAPEASFVFSPVALTIILGDTVHWVWEGAPHNVVSGIPDFPTPAFDSGALEGAGFTFDVVFDQAFVDANPEVNHEYPYYCEPHGFFGMVGTITVNIPAPICVGDITPPGGNGVVNIDDLVAVLNAFGPCVGCPEDITPPGGNGVVNIDDLVAVLNAFGACP